MKACAKERPSSLTQLHLRGYCSGLFGLYWCLLLRPGVRAAKCPQGLGWRRGPGWSPVLYEPQYYKQAEEPNVKWGEDAFLTWINFLTIKRGIILKKKEGLIWCSQMQWFSKCVPRPQHQHSLGTVWQYKFSGPAPVLMNQKLLEWGSTIYINKPWRWF